MGISKMKISAGGSLICSLILLQCGTNLTGIKSPPHIT